jgi:uncharacterized membrane protein
LHPFASQDNIGNIGDFFVNLNKGGISMLIAAEAAKEKISTGTFGLFGITFDYFDLFVIAFTILIAVGVIRSLLAKEQNKVAIGFGGVSLLVFLFMDVIMVQHWFSA